MHVGIQLDYDSEGAPDSIKPEPEDVAKLVAVRLQETIYPSIDIEKCELALTNNLLKREYTPYSV